MQKQNLISKFHYFCMQPFAPNVLSNDKRLTINRTKKPIQEINIRSEDIRNLPTHSALTSGGNHIPFDVPGS